MQEGTNSAIYTPENIKAATGAIFSGATGFAYLDVANFTYVPHVSTGGSDTVLYSFLEIITLLMYMRN